MFSAENENDIHIHYVHICSLFFKLDIMFFVYFTDCCSGQKNYGIADVGKMTGGFYCEIIRHELGVLIFTENLLFRN